MTTRSRRFIVLCLCVAASAAGAVVRAPAFGQEADAAAEPQTAAAAFSVAPESVTLHGHFARAQLVVRERDAAGGLPATRSADLTHKAAYISSNPAVVSVDEAGRLLAVGDGTAEITVAVESKAVAVPVAVGGLAGPPDVRFLRDVLPVLSKAGCSMGACHASQYGKGGFKLSV
ncbi:MAG TPA: hypothetical protein VML55_11765, partial [Planctomycetaceae bacterium]|nr:hypothetical protein [Planctomycetaceae bacterium]